METGRVDRELWTALGEMGLHGVAVAGSSADVLIAATELGRCLAPVPLLQHASATFFVHELGLAVDGGRVISWLLSAETWEQRGTEGAGIVPYAQDLDDVLWAQPTAEGVGLWLVPRESLSVRRMPDVDLTFPLSALAWEPQGEPWARVDRADFARAAARVRALSGAWLCGEVVGGAEACMSALLEHLETREQFGQPIGAFQAVQHKAADLAILLEGMRSFWDDLHARLESGEEDLDRSATLAKPYVTDAYVEIAETSLQLFGGMGFTWEHHSHLHLRHAHRCRRLFGEPSTLRRESLGLDVDM